MQTIIPGLFRRVHGITYKRQRLKTPDEDFLDLDWSKVGGKDAVIICHGLEGNSSRAYVKGMVKAFNSEGLDALAWNYRGCSEQINQKLRFYHSGATDDLELVIKKVSGSTNYDRIFLIGFSLGGNMILKYLGEKGNHSETMVRRAVTFSVPLQLHSSCLQLSRGFSKVYERRFLRKLKAKVKRKAVLYPAELDLKKLPQIKSLIAFDDHYTAPIHGFGNALNYYQSCSSINFIDQISVPTLVVNALNDPFLSPDCYPRDQLREHSFVQLETPSAGGHCGFQTTLPNSGFWSERRAVEFLLNSQ
ncbi:MAG: YheT family hydrolase [Cyclobacteriaceae bacterium]